MASNSDSNGLPLAFGLMAVGGILMVSGFKGLSVSDVFRGVTGSKLDPKGGGTGSANTPTDSTGIGITAEGSIKATGVQFAAAAIGARHYPYVWGGGHAHAGTPDNGDGSDKGIGYDCSGAVAAACAAAGIIKAGSAVGRSDQWAAANFRPGQGTVTAWANAEHIFMIGKNGAGVWRLDTASGQSSWYVRSSRSTAGFTPYVVVK